MWHVVKVEYSLPPARERRHKLEAYGPFAAAQRIFERLELAYQLATPLRIKGGGAIAVHGVKLYEARQENLPQALAAVESGQALLMQEAQGADFAL